MSKLTGQNSTCQVLKMGWWTKGAFGTAHPCSLRWRSRSPPDKLSHVLLADPCPYAKNGSNSVHILSKFGSNCHFGYKYLPKCVKNLAATISLPHHVSLFLSQHMFILHNIMSTTFGEPHCFHTSELHENNLIAHTGTIDEQTTILFVWSEWFLSLMKLPDLLCSLIRHLWAELYYLSSLFDPKLYDFC